MSEVKEKNKKLLLIGGIVGVIALISILIYYCYFYIYRDTSRYLDKMSNNIVETIGKVFEDINSNQNTYLNELDYNLKGNVNVEVDNEKLDINLDIKNSNKNLISSVDLSLLHNNKRLIGGNIYFQDNKMYLKSKEIYKNILEISLDNNLLATEGNAVDFSYMIFTNMEDLEYLITSLTKYHIEALKEGKLSTKTKGLTEKQYIIKINATDKINANKKLEELIKNDSKLSGIIKTYKIEEYNYLSTGEIILNVNTFSNELNSFVITTSDFDLEGKYDGEKYVLTDEKTDYAYLWITEKNIKMEVYVDDELSTSLNINNSDDNMSASLLVDGDSMDFAINKFDEKTNELTFKVHSTESDLDMNITAKISAESDKKVNFEGNGNVTSEGTSVQLTFNMTLELGDDLISRLDVTNAKNIDDLKENELNELVGNVYTLMEKYGLYDENNLMF